MPMFPWDPLEPFSPKGPSLIDGTALNKMVEDVNALMLGTNPSTGGGAAGGFLNAKDAPYNAVGDGIEDDTNAIQSALDDALRLKLPGVFLPSGQYKTTNTIQVGYGYSFQTVALVGPDVPPGVDPGYGAGLFPTFQDRPVVNIQGIRYGGVENIQIWGPARATVGNPLNRSKAFGSQAANYVPTGAKDDPRAPFCGVCIDGYSGSAPGNPYPLPTLPAFLGGGTGSYGRSSSSGPYVRSCQITGTLIGVCSQPNSNTNGDFLDCYGSRFLQNKVSVSWGNINARSNNMDSTNHYASHTLFDTVNYGLNGRGNCAGNYNNLHVNFCYQIFNLNQRFQVPFAVTSLYAETLMRVGTWGAQASGGGGFPTFYGCSFELHPYVTASGALSEVYIEGELSDATNYYGCAFAGNLSCFMFADCYFDRCWFNPTCVEVGNSGVFAVPQAESDAISGFGSVFIDTFAQTGSTLDATDLNPRIKASLIAADASVNTYYDGYDTANPKTYYSVGMAREFIANYVAPNILVPKSATSLYNNRVISGRGFTTSQATPGTLGDVLYYPQRKTWLYQSAVSGVGPYIQTFTALNNYQLTGTGGANLVLWSEELWKSVQWTTGGFDDVTADTTIAPNGTLTADSLVEDASNGEHFWGINNAVPITPGATYTWSIYLKPSLRTWAVVYFQGGPGEFFQASFHLSGAGTIGTQLAGPDSAISGAAISAEANGFYRCSITGHLGPTTDGGNGYVDSAIGDVTVFTPGPNSIYPGVFGGTALIGWGAMLNAGGLVAYVATAGPVYSLLSDLTNTGDTCFFYPMKLVSGAPSVQARRNWVTVSGSNVVTFTDENGTPVTLTGSLADPTNMPFWYGSRALINLQRWLPFQAETTISSVGTNTITMNHNAQASGVHPVCPGITKSIAIP